MNCYREYKQYEDFVGIGSLEAGGPVGERPKWVCRYQQGEKGVWLEVKCWSVVRVDDNYADTRFCTDMKVILELKYVK
jgi:hypothetical protein